MVKLKLTKQSKRTRERKKKETEEINRERWWTNKQGTKQTSKQTHKEVPGLGTIEFQS
jgi:hypothetical protein